LLASPLTPDEDENGLVEKVVDVMHITGTQLLDHLHHVTKHLEFWKTLSVGGENDKLSFMILERGPIAFYQGAKRFVRSYFVEATPGQELFSAASARVSERVAVLDDLRERFASIIGQMHIEVDKMGEKVSSGDSSGVAASECVLAILKALSVFEGGYFLPQKDYHNYGDSAPPITLALYFNELPDALEQRLEWTSSELEDALNLLSDRMWKLQNFLDTFMWQYRRPRRAVRKWLQYSGGALGLGILSVWLFRHSSYAGSNDLNRWTKEAVGAAAGFWEEHVQEPLVSIRDDLFDTFHKRNREGHELSDVKISADSLHRMLKEFVAKTKGPDVAEDVSEQQLMELMMNRYETELVHPIRNIFAGELARALLIQVQKLKLDVETAMLDLNQILRANEINFAVLAAMPAVLGVFLIGWLLKRPFTKGKGAEGRGRRAQLRRRMLMVDVENAVMNFQILVDERNEDRNQEDGFPHFGSLIYSLDRLYKSVRKPAKESGEWQSLERDIIELSKPRLSTFYKLAIASRMERVYEVLVPIPKLR
jgi:nuclear-control-of-ATPase protein 2